MKVRAWLAAPVAAWCLISTALPAQQPTNPGSPYTVVTRDARRPLATRVMGGQEMFALDDLTRLFNLTVREDAAAGGLTISSGAQTIVLSPQQPLASVAGRMISLPAAPVRDGRAWYVPVDFVSRALASIHPTRLELRKPSRLLLVGDVRMPRIAARGEVAGPSTRVTIDVAPPTPHTVSQEATRLLVRFEADALDLGELRVTPNDVVQAVHPTDAPGVLAIDLGPRFASFRASDQPAPAPASGRIVVDVFAQTEAPAPGGPPAAQPPATPPVSETPPLLDLPPAGGLGAIVIDAGHGGDDTGAKGAEGTLEKNVTQSVARRLKAALEARLGVRVLLTRDGDQSVASDQRAAFANNNKADLFISLHANASTRPNVSGAQVFYLDLDGYSDTNQRGAGNPERLPVLGGGTREIEITPWEMAQARYIEQSAAFAKTIEGALRERVPMSPRSLQHAPFRVLVGANMPAVLVEMGFLTNRQQEQQLAGDEHQNVLVQALVEGIVRYRTAAAREPQASVERSRPAAGGRR